MFEQFYNLKYILNDPNTLIILPVYINSTVNSIEEYINKMPIKEFGIKSIKKELINLIQSFKLKDNSSNSETITKYDNVFFLKCIYTKSNFTEEEYKENINTELLRLINVLKERFQTFMSSTNQKYLPYKKIILFKNTKNDISVDYFSSLTSKKNINFLNKYINDFFKSNKYYNINSGIQQFNINEKFKIPLIYSESNNKNILEFYNLEPKTKDKSETYKSTIEAFQYLTYLTQFLYKSKFLGEKKDEEKSISIKTDTFKILYKKNKINIDEYNITNIHISTNNPYNIELSSISNTIELHGYFKQKKGNYYILQLNEIYNNNLFNYILKSVKIETMKKKAKLKINLHHMK